MLLALTGGASAALLILKLEQKYTKSCRRAVCVFSGEIEGCVEMESAGKYTRFTCKLSGFKREGLHGMHVHNKGDLRQGCESTCSHYNPTKSTHGGPMGSRRHRGDLGNIKASKGGVCEDTVLADVRLDEIIGRTLLIHEDEDNLGREKTESSLATGDAGRRIACGVIGRLD